MTIPDPSATVTTDTPATSWQALSRPSRSGQRRVVIALIAAAAVVLVGLGVMAYTLAPTLALRVLGKTLTMTVHGTMTINGGCSSWGYEDIRSGTQVVVTDQNNTVLATGNLASAGSCTWAFTLDNVPTGRTFYGVTVSHRGTVQFTQDQLRSGVDLSLG